MPSQPGQASQLLVQANDILNQLGDIVSKSQLPPEDKQQFGQLMSEFNSFAENMSQPVGANKPSAPAPQGVVPSETAGKPAMPMMNMGKM